MQLPNGENAVVDIGKLRGYCLNPDHPRGRHKARVFATAAGFTAEHAEILRQALRLAARTEDAVQVAEDSFGRRFRLEFNVEGPKGEVRVRSSWIVQKDEHFPRFVSCFVV